MNMSFLNMTNIPCGGNACSEVVFNWPWSSLNLPWCLGGCYGLLPNKNCCLLVVLKCIAYWGSSSHVGQENNTYIVQTN